MNTIFEFIHCCQMKFLGMELIFYSKIWKELEALYPFLKRIFCVEYRMKKII